MFIITRIHYIVKLGYNDHGYNKYTVQHVSKRSKRFHGYSEQLFQISRL